MVDARRRIAGIGVALATVFFPAAASAVEAAPAPDARPAPELRAASPWKFDLDLGLPAFGAGETSLAFDVAGGYTGESIGADANIAQSSYSLASAGGASATSEFTLAANA